MKELFSKGEWTKATPLVPPSRLVPFLPHKGQLLPPLPVPPPFCLKKRLIETHVEEEGEKGGWREGESVMEGGRSMERKTCREKEQRFGKIERWGFC